MEIIFKNGKMSEKYHEIIERAAVEQQKAIQDEKAAKQKETEIRKEKSIEKATKFIVEKFHEETGIR